MNKYTSMFARVVGLAVLCNALWFGCATAPNPSGGNSDYVEVNGVIEMDDIYAAVNVYPLNGATIADATYSLPTKRWVETGYANLLASKFYDKTYKLESFDCDNYSLGGQDVASVINATGKHQLAIGVFYYVKDDSARGHAINIFLYKDGNEVKSGFFEPQTGKVIRLSEREIESCSHWRF